MRRDSRADFRRLRYPDHARETLVLWKTDYSTVRRHSALGNLPPAIYAALDAPT
jgi:transposase InsO family protein